MTCLGSTLLTKDEPESTSEYADEGTDFHELAAVVLEDEDLDASALAYVGHEMPSGRVVTEENAQYIQQGYVDYVRAYAAGGTLLIEEACPIDHLTGESGAKGTADAVVIRPDSELIVIDLKFGRGVEVSVERNRQAMTYALGVIKKHDLDEVVTTVRIVICQPRIGDGKPKEWVVGIEELLAFGEEIKQTAKKIVSFDAKGTATWAQALPLSPSEKACRFCKAKATCPALKGFVDGRMAEGFENLEARTMMPHGLSLSRSEVLGRAMDGISMIELYIKGIQSQAEIDLLAGKPVLGIDGPYKLVAGKKGNRKWDSEDEVEELFKKQFRLKEDDMYTKSLISPTLAEKFFKKLDSPGRWTKAQKHITQSDGGKHVAPATDPRPAIEQEKPEAGFTTVSDAEEFI
jgi:hypothetical protein